MSLSQSSIRFLGALILLMLIGVQVVEAREFPHKAEVVKIQELNYNIKRITFKPKTDDFEFTAGQYIFVKAPESYIDAFNKTHGTDHGEISRPYSFASSPSNKKTFDLIIKHYGPRRGRDVPPGVMSTFIHKHLKVGDVLDFSGARGRLYEPQEANRPIVMIAGSVGGSPFVGLSQYFFENQINEKRKIYLFLGVNSKRDLFLHDLFIGWTKKHKNFYYIPSLSRPAEGDKWTGETGYINLAFGRYFKEKLDADVYIAGSPIMRRETIKVLKAKGIPDGQIRTDPIKVGDE
ncbi:MAG: FAD-binding oxidoreductase [Planctomycetes bacterium]|nr:FAD-binding oxidoreductase [Planctomycetota bacterium]